MGWFSDIIKEYPAFLAETQRLGQLDAENIKRKKDNAALQTKRIAVQTRGRFTEFEGVLWTHHNGDVDTIVYCPSCEFAMAVFPPRSNEKVVCSKCSFVAPFQPQEIEKLARSLEAKLSST